MAFNTLEYLKAGKVEFLFNFSSYDRDALISLVRKAENRNEIINGFLPLLKDSYYSFCFEIIYDLEEYKDDAKYILDKYIGYNHLTKEQYEAILFHTSWGKDYTLDHMNEILKDGDDVLLIIFRFIFQDIKAHADLIHIFYLHKDLHIRFLFMNFIIQNHPVLINVIYDDFTKHLTGYSQLEFEQISFLPMDMEDICKLAVSVFESSLDRRFWLQLKSYILETYKKNKLASLLLEDKKTTLEDGSWKYTKNEAGVIEFCTDADHLFETSADFRFSILLKYPHLVSQSILERYRKIIDCFSRNRRYDYSLSSIYAAGLGTKLEEYVDKYLSLSTSREVKPLNEGTTTSPYRIGDYVIKLVKTKWSYEPIICPDLFLIIKNLEEDYVRDKQEIVTVGIEVQQYLTKSARDVPNDIICEFENALKTLGWYAYDRLLLGCTGDNCMLLNSYKDAYCENPEELPDWFKEYPMVLVDRDLVFRISNKHPKRQRQHFSG